MKLTGKCKEDFEKWRKLQPYNADAPYFYELNYSMQYGVCVDWFDSVGIIVHSGKSLERFNWYATTTLKHYQSKLKDSRPEARTAAIEKANEIYNNN